MTLRFYWVSPAMSQIYTELRPAHRAAASWGRVGKDGRPRGDAYAITDPAGQALRTWMRRTPAGFPVLKHTVAAAAAARPRRRSRSDDAAMLHDYLADARRRAAPTLAEVRESLRGADGPGEPFRYPSLVADWGLDYFAAETPA